MPTGCYLFTLLFFSSPYHPSAYVTKTASAGFIYFPCEMLLYEQTVSLTQYYHKERTLFCNAESAVILYTYLSKIFFCPSRMDDQIRLTFS
jgi:hypothetical protein